MKLDEFELWAFQRGRWVFRAFGPRAAMKKKAEKIRRGCDSAGRPRFGLWIKRSER